MKSDLGVRTLSAIVMLAVAGGALWLGGWFWAVFVALIAMGVLWEWRALVRSFAETAVRRMIWNLAGFLYIAAAIFALLLLGQEPIALLIVLGAVIATDIGAYFAGRTIGGPKIAPRISPSKTWAGLIGGMFAATLALLILYLQTAVTLCETLPCDQSSMAERLRQLSGTQWVRLIAAGALIALVAQVGDFFESWMKRRAGVKDSGALLPGHGGLFDRTDGLLAVCFVVSLLMLISYASSGWAPL